MYKINDIYSFLTKKYPLKLQEKWDESGKITYFEGNLSGIVVCLDLNMEAINLAIKKHANLIVSHHPMFKDCAEHKQTKNEKQVLKALKDNKISAIALHTCFDNSPIGMNQLFLKNTNIFKNINITKNKEGTYGKGDLTIAKTTSQLATFLKTKNSLIRTIYLTEFKNIPVKSIAVCCGAGFSVLKQLIESSAKFDCYITGDLKWHDWQYVKANNVNVLDVGHDIENIFAKNIINDLNKEYGDISLYPCLSIIKMQVK